jgi:hypothetical protein
MPLPIPSKHWEIISMDFVGGFPMSHRFHNYMFVMVDLFNKICALIPWKKTISRQEATKLFFSRVWVHFGLTRSIISN